MSNPKLPSLIESATVIEEALSAYFDELGWPDALFNVLERGLVFTYDHATQDYTVGVSGFVDAPMEDPKFRQIRISVAITCKLCVEETDTKISNVNVSINATAVTHQDKIEWLLGFLNDQPSEINLRSLTSLAQILKFPNDKLDESFWPNLVEAVSRK